MRTVNINYEKRLVAYIDVMGFKELLKDDDESKTKLNKYYQTAQNALERFSEMYKDLPDQKFKKFFVSDAIILSIKISENKTNDLFTAARFFRIISLLQYELATDALVWTRGAISIGDLHLDEVQNILVGQAFVQSYQLEAVADYPRVIIDPQILKYYNLSPASFASHINEQIYDSKVVFGHKISHRPDLPPLDNDAYFVDWFREIFAESNDVQSFFKDLFERRYRSQRLFEKTNKLIRYFHESTFQFQEDSENEIGITSHPRFDHIREQVESLG